jgi:hypothetical protein
MCAEWSLRLRCIRGISWWALKKKKFPSTSCLFKFSGSDKRSMQQPVIQVQISTTIPWSYQPQNAQYLCPQHSHHKKPLLTGSFQLKFHFHTSKTKLAACYLMHCDTLEYKSSILNWINTKQCVCQAVTHGKLNLEEPWTSWGKWNITSK